MTRPMTRRMFAIAWVTLLLVVFVSNVWADRESCLRANGVRAAALITYEGAVHRASERAMIDHGAARRIDLEAVTADVASSRQVQPIDCNAIFLSGTK